MDFKLHSKYQPTGDQPQAIDELCKCAAEGTKYQTLLGVTGSGKTFTMANVIERLNRPTLVLSHNKTLAAQLYAEFKNYFPDNAVHYFVSYYDYYQPEAYIPSSDKYIENDNGIDFYNVITTTRHCDAVSDEHNILNAINAAATFSIYKKSDLKIAKAYRILTY